MQLELHFNISVIANICSDDKYKDHNVTLVLLNLSMICTFVLMLFDYVYYFAVNDETEIYVPEDDLSQLNGENNLEIYM